MRNIFAKLENFDENLEFYCCKNQLLKRTCGILCSSESSIFEVLLCHKNNFSSFTLINVWWREVDFTSYLFKFPNYFGSSPPRYYIVFYKERSSRSKKYFQANLWIVWCLLVVLKSIFILCVNPSIWLADKSLFKVSLFRKNFVFVLKNSVFFGKFSCFLQNLNFFSRNFSLFTIHW